MQIHFSKIGFDDTLYMVMIMREKKRFRLKKRFKKYIGFTIFFALAVLSIYKLISFSLYKNTLEYKLLNKGYDRESVDLISKLPEDEVEYLIESEKIDYIKNIIGDKYFLEKNFYIYLDHFDKNSKLDFRDLVKVVNVGTTKNFYEDVKTTDISNKYEVLVNKYYALPEDYDPGVIKTFSSTYAYGQVSAEETCYNAFIEMAKAAKKDGVTLILTAGYRSHASIKTAYDDLKERKGQDYADEHSTRPGQNEHETGLALDILTYNGLLETFKTTEAYAWLHENAQDYGFLERYQEGWENLTGYSPESWHYRYVGVELAKKVKDEGISYEEYYAYYLEK